MKNKLLMLNFKNVDFKLLKFNKLFYNNISDYLNSKYCIKLNESINLMNLNGNKHYYEKKKIRLYFVNFKPSKYQTYQINRIVEILSSQFEISFVFFKSD